MDKVKILMIRVTPDLYKKIKHRLIDREITLKDYLTELIEADLADSKREQAPTD
jgi:hypothetical protein